MTDKPTKPQAGVSSWDNVAPVGREFGSADYERLAELDHFAVKAHGTLLRARQWLEAPNATLDGLTPETVAKTPEGFERVKQLLTS